jgi:hypothetical protein
MASRCAEGTMMDAWGGMMEPEPPVPLWKHSGFVDSGG